MTYVLIYLGIGIFFAVVVEWRDRCWGKRPTAMKIIALFVVSWAVFLPLEIALRIHAWHRRRKRKWD